MNNPNRDQFESAKSAASNRGSESDRKDHVAGEIETESIPETESVTPADSNKSAFAQPATIGNYAVKRVLGQGGMGCVYLCEQANPRREVAVKVISSRLSADAIRRFQLEAETLARLQHRGIAQIFEAGTFHSTEGQQPFIAMELVAGKPLSTQELIDWSLQDRARLLVDICLAVEHAHQNGVIHRDLKPGNILVTDEHNPKILDFGLARSEENDPLKDSRQTEAGQILGTLAYMSPEQASGDPTAVDTRSDVYSLGVIAYELFTGKLPIVTTRKNLAESLTSIREHEPTSIGKLNPACKGDLETIVDKSLQKDKDRRYQSVAELRSDFERHLQKIPIVARPSSAWYRCYRFAQRNRGVVGAAATTLLTLLVSLVVVSSLLLYANGVNSKLSTRNQQLSASRSIALDAQNVAEERLAETYVLSARIAARRGQWREALDLYDKRMAMIQNEEDIQIERVRLLTASGNREEAKELIFQLSDRTNERNRAQLNLLSGELLLFEWGDTDEAIELIQHAITSGHLSRSDVCYARGLINDNTTEALEHFQNALNDNPFHHQARIMHAFMLILLGRLSEAQAEIAVARLVHPDDEVAEGLEIMIQVLAGEQEIASERVRALAPKIGDRTAEGVAAALEQVAILLDKFQQTETEPGWGDLMTAYAQMMRVSVQYADVFSFSSGDLLLSVPNHPVLRRLVEFQRNLFLALPFGRYQRIVDIAHDLNQSHPMDVLMALEAAARIELAFQARDRGDMETAKTEFERASILYEQAAVNPSFVESLTRTSEFGWVNTDADLLDYLPPESREHEALRDEMLANLRQYAFQPNLGLFELSNYAMNAFIVDDHESAKALTRRWLEREPESAMAVHILAMVEARTGNFYQAIELINKVLKITPDDEAAIESRDAFIEAYLKQSAELRKIVPELGDSQSEEVP